MADGRQVATRAKSAGGGRATHAWIGVVGIALVLCSSFFVIGALGDLHTGGSPDSDPAVLLGLAVFFLLLAACGVWMAVANLGQPRQAAAPSAEARILALAEERDGRLTVDEVAAACGLSLAQSKDALDRLVAA